MARVILVRHGRTTANTAGVLAGRTDAELDDHGRTQAQELAAALLPLELRAAVTSPMLRTRQTLDLLLGNPGTIDSHIDDDLAEVDYGEWTGKSIKELSTHPLWGTVQRHPASVTFPGGESMAQMSARSVAAVRRWSTWADEESDNAAATTAAEPSSPGPAPTVLVVSHGDIIKAIVADALGMHLDAFQRICIDPCSVSVVHYSEGRPFVECVNADGSVLRSWRNPAAAAVQAVPGGGAGR